MITRKDEFHESAILKKQKAKSGTRGSRPSEPPGGGSLSHECSVDEGHS